MRRRLLDNINRVRERVEAACARRRRSPDDVHLVAVTKYVNEAIIKTLVEIGLGELGESRPQNLVRRATAIQQWLVRRSKDADAPHCFPPCWHQIGPLQRNKVAKILPWVSLIHSVDSLRLAEEIDTQSAKLNLVTPILLEINASGEEGKHGVIYPAGIHLAEALTSLSHVRLRGLMTMGPTSMEEKETRLAFERTQDLFHQVRDRGVGGPSFNILSMGMSADFEWAVECDATHVRVGRALYEGIELPSEEDEEE